jgi:hypothetical protein
VGEAPKAPFSARRGIEGPDLAVGAFTLAGALVAGRLLTPHTHDETSATLLVLLCVLVLLPFYVAFRRGSLLLSEPVFYTVVILALAYPAQALYAILVEPFTTHADTWLDPDVMRRSLTYCVLGVSAYLATYYASARVTARWTMSWLPLPDTELSPPRILGVYGAGVLVRLYMIVTGNFATFYEWSGYDRQTVTVLWTVAQLPWLAYTLAWLAALRPRATAADRLTLVGLCVLETIYHLTISASKTFLSHLVLYPILVLSLRRRRTPWIPAAAFGVALIVFIFPFVISQRAQLQMAPAIGVGDLDVLVGVARDASTHTTESLEGQGSLSSRLEVVLGRWHGFDSLGMAVLMVPERIGFLYFRDLLLLPTALIPRAIAPWKAESTFGTLFAEEIYGGSGGISAFPIAEGYVNGGAIGVVLLMAALALLQNWFYRGFFLSRSRQGLAAGIYLYFFFQLTNVDSSLVLGWIGLIQTTAILAVVVLVFFSGRRRPSRG